MADNDQHESTDLLEGNSSTDTNAPDGDGTENSNLLSEENQIQSPAKDKPTDPAMIKRQQQVDAWVAKGPEGLKDLPKDKEWLRPHIEAVFKLQEKEPEIDKLIEQKLAKKEADNRYANLKANLQAMKLKKEQVLKIQARQDQLISRGVPRDEALEIASEAAGVSLDLEDQNRMILRQRMALPAQGSNRVYDADAKPDDPDFHKKVMNPKDKMRILMEHMRS